MLTLALVMRAFPGFTFQDLRSLPLREVGALAEAAERALSSSP